MKAARVKIVKKNDDSMARDLMALSCFVTLSLSTSLTVDAFTPIKFAGLNLGVFYMYTRYWRFIFSGLISSKKLIILIWGFFAHSALILATNHYSISERLFGIQGRFFGFITIWSLYLYGLVIFFAVKNRKLSIESILKCLLFANLVVGLVFFIQKLGIGFTDFQNDYSVLPSTLGNPNFLAAFVACSVFASLYFVLLSRRDLSRDFWLGAVSIVLSLLIAAVSGSLQGPLGIGLGFILLLILFALRLKPKLTIITTGLLSILIIPLIQGLFGRGFLGDRLEQGTLVLRTIYWRIAGRMGIDRPLFGQGFDTYLDNYREFRTSDEVLDYGLGIISDSPHNLYLDFLVTGGLPYSLWGLAGSAYVIFSAFKVLKLLRLKDEPFFSSIFLITIWLVLSILALINPFQLAVNVWNVVTGFAIAGYYHQLLGENQVKRHPKETRVKNETLLKSFFALSIFVFVNPLVAATPMATEIRFRSAVEKSDYEALRSVATDWPFAGSRVVAISQGIVGSSRALTSTTDQALERQLQDMIQSANTDALAATKINPESFDLWNFIFYNHPDSSVREEARDNLKRLDPQDPSWVTAKP